MRRFIIRYELSVPEGAPTTREEVTRLGRRAEDDLSNACWSGPLRLDVEGGAVVFIDATEAPPFPDLGMHDRPTSGGPDDAEDEPYDGRDPEDPHGLLAIRERGRRAALAAPDPRCGQLLTLTGPARQNAPQALRCWLSRGHEGAHSYELPAGCVRAHGPQGPACGPGCWLAQPDPGDPSTTSEEQAQRAAQRFGDLYRELNARELPCGHRFADLIGGADSVTKCGACLAERRGKRPPTLVTAPFIATPADGEHEQVLVLQPLGEVGRSIVEQVAAAGMAGRRVACGLDPQEVAHA